MVQPSSPSDLSTAGAVAAEGTLGRTERRGALLVALLSFLLYNSNLRAIASGDTYPARFLPMAVLHDGSLFLDHLVEATKMGHPSAYWILSVNGRSASMYPLVTPLLATPLYLPATLYLDRRGWDDVAELQRVAEVMEKIAASLIAATAVGLMYCLLRRSLARGRALLVVAAFALGTETWAISSQALWQHGTAELLAIVVLMAITRPPTVSRMVVAGLAAGLFIANRPPDALLAAGFALYALFWVRPWRLSAAFFAAAAAPLALMIAYDWSVFGNLSGGYGYVLGNGAGYAAFFRFPLATGLAGQLVSPAKGLLVYSPFLLFLLAYARRRRPASHRALAACLAVGILLQLLMYAKTDWRGGFSYGPRYLTDMLPMLVWMLAPVVASLGRVGLGVFALAASFSTYVQVVGVFCYPGGGSDQIYYPAAPRSDDLTPIWRIQDAAFLLEAKSDPESHFEFLRLWPAATGAAQNSR